MNWLDRQIKLIGEEKTELLKSKSIMIFGIGGVGSFAAEAAARTGIGNIVLIDNDVVSESNINRQLIATTKTIGRYKTEIMKERILEINPYCNVRTFNAFYPEQKETIFDTKPDFIIDAIDNVTGKIDIIKTASEHNIPFICALGTGNKTNPELLKISDISKTNTCPLARIIRTETRKLGINHFPVVFSTELPHKTNSRTPSSISFVPPVAGMYLTSYAVRKLIGEI